MLMSKLIDEFNTLLEALTPQFAKYGLDQKGIEDAVLSQMGITREILERDNIIDRVFTPLEHEHDNRQRLRAKIKSLRKIRNG